MTHDKMFKEMLNTLTASRQVDESIFVECANECCSEEFCQDEAHNCENCGAALCEGCGKQFDFSLCEECYRGIESEREYYKDLDNWYRATR